MTFPSYAEQARAKKMANAIAMGIDDALISQLVERFYNVIRKDDLLGPIFAAHVADWPWHLTRMKEFWASVTMESGRFHGNPMHKHINIGSLEQLHFERWLMLWDRTVNEVAPSPAASDTFRLAAKRIARSLLMGIENT
ncbi:MAG: group III truncated hemoglobin [Rhodospirillales bacterium]